MSRSVMVLIACVFVALLSYAMAEEESTEELPLPEAEPAEDRTFLYNLWSNGVSCSSNSTICSSYSGYTTCRNFIFKGKYCSKY